MRRTRLSATRTCSRRRPLGVELGIAHAWDEGSLTLTVFEASLDDEIDGFVFDPDSLGFTARNIDASSRRRGGELTLDANWQGARWRAAYALRRLDER